MSGVPKDQWCTCEPKREIDGVAYPPAAKGFLQRMFGGGGSAKEEGKEDL